MSEDAVRKYIDMLAGNDKLDEESVKVGFSAGVDAVARTIEAAAMSLSGSERRWLMSYAADVRAKVKYPKL